MKTRTLVLLFVMSLAAFAQPQMGQTPSDREYEKRSRQIEANTTYPVPVQRPKLDWKRVKSEADELAKLAQTVPPQIDQTGNGVLPKDLGQNLKEIEKLAKHLRRELNL